MRDLVIRRCEPEDYKAVHLVYSSPQAMAETLGVPYSSEQAWRDELARERDDNFAVVACVQGEVVEIEGTHRRFAYRNGEYVDAHVMARLRADCDPAARATQP